MHAGGAGKEGDVHSHESAGEVVRMICPDR